MQSQYVSCDGNFLLYLSLVRNNIFPLDNC